ncbi:hypothetical protein B0H17DRAFT_1291367 [Mycena rosella]|uniref:Uncharacterized protein n=1 Tax=Mycena rosella TaxID=1033263 RepID=A0AAD7DF46_MYCRO|nr:hypothetical protein B0H17DRAFT_1291367 [Mycena rosella]
MILSGHSLAIERRRWKERGKPVVPREWRLYRFCSTYIEDPPHAMFVCDHPNLMQLREIFLAKLYKDLPAIRGKCSTPWEFFRELLAHREITPLLAKLAHDVLKIFDATPMLCTRPAHIQKPHPEPPLIMQFKVIAFLAACFTIVAAQTAQPCVSIPRF